MIAFSNRRPKLAATSRLWPTVGVCCDGLLVLTELGGRLREWMAEHHRPLLWSDQVDGPMMLDPIVASQIPGFSHSGLITAKDKALFEQAWVAGRPMPAPPGLNESCAEFESLVAEALPHLHFTWQSWNNKAACDAIEADEKNVIMGTDGNGKCVYWTAPAAPTRWECRNDGTCEPSADASRALFDSESQCVSECATRFQCVRVTGTIGNSSDPKAPRDSVAYCLPSLGNTTSALGTVHGKIRDFTGTQTFPSV